MKNSIIKKHDLVLREAAWEQTQAWEAGEQRACWEAKK
jgi:hypothetical protein